MVSHCLLCLPLYTFLCCVFVLCCSCKCTFEFCNSLAGEKKTDRFVSLFSCCVLALSILCLSLSLSGVTMGLCVIVIFPDHSKLLIENECMHARRPMQQKDLKREQIYISNK